MKVPPCFKGENREAVITSQAGIPERDANQSKHIIYHHLCTLRDTLQNAKNLSDLNHCVVHINVYYFRPPQGFSETFSFHVFSFLSSLTDLIVQNTAPKAFT